MTFIEGCKNPQAVTLLIRGATDRLTAEIERSIHDALCVVKDVIEEPKIVAGGAAPEIEMARSIRKYAESLPGKEQLAVLVFADALETIAVAITQNAGLEPIDVISELRSKHEQGETWYGLEAREGKTQDMAKIGVLEPISVKKQIIKSATEAATMILKIDDVIAAGKMKTPPTPPGGAPGGGYPGMGEY
jgi:chaperonin GroEL (HSP60 family)